jgi:tyrosinase
LHHWHWHLVYPFDASNQGIVAKDRRGELFYYMHQQIVARYNFERFSNRMARVKRLNNMREPIAEAYFPKMTSLVASRAWPSRVANTKMMDLNRELDQIRSQVSDLERWRDRFYEAIHQGFVVDQSGNRIALDNERGIDYLGNMMESSILSPNQQLYGDFHNMLHVFIALAHDPDNRHLETFGVIGDAGTAMRDPAFYRIHSFVDDIFQEHKQRLPPYTLQQLTFPRMSVVGVNIAADSGPPNRLQTHWQQSDIDMSRGMDFVTMKGNVLATFTHLNHVPFTYNIQVINDSGEVKMGMVRIFLAPKKDQRGLNMALREQRLMMTEMDKFVAACKFG